MVTRHNVNQMVEFVIVLLETTCLGDLGTNPDDQEMLSISRLIKDSMSLSHPTCDKVNQSSDDLVRSGGHDPYSLH